MKRPYCPEAWKEGRPEEDAELRRGTVYATGSRRRWNREEDEQLRHEVEVLHLDWASIGRLHNRTADAVRVQAAVYGFASARRRGAAPWSKIKAQKAMLASVL